MVVLRYSVAVVLAQNESHATLARRRAARRPFALTSGLASREARTCGLGSFVMPKDLHLPRLFRLKRATCFSRLRPAGIGGYTTTVSDGVG